jgi:hypothetical protein
MVERRNGEVKPLVSNGFEGSFRGLRTARQRAPDSVRDTLQHQQVGVCLHAHSAPSKS